MTVRLTGEVALSDEEFSTLEENIGAVAVLALLRDRMGETPAFSLSWAISTSAHYLANRLWALPSGRTSSVAVTGFRFSTTASASFLAGFVQERVGWVALNQGAVVLVAVSCLAVVWLKLQRQPALAA